MTDLSPRMMWPTPSLDDDPWFEFYQDQIRAQDASGFAAREDRNIILSGGGLLTWNVSTGLTWTESFLVWSPSTGFFSRLVPATLLPLNGQIIRAEITRAPGQSVNVTAEVASIARNTDDSFVLGLRSGTNFVFRNGIIIKNGTTILAVNLFGGGGGDDNFSYKVVVTGKSVTVPANQQMVVSGGITIDGELILNGELALIP
jgi:hypothetical protein